MMYAAIRTDNQILPEVWAFFADDPRDLILLVEKCYGRGDVLIQKADRFRGEHGYDGVYVYGCSWEAGKIIDNHTEFVVTIEDDEIIIGRWTITEIKEGGVV